MIARAQHHQNKLCNAAMSLVHGSNWLVCDATVRGKPGVDATSKSIRVDTARPDLQSQFTRNLRFLVAILKIWREKVKILY